MPLSSRRSLKSQLPPKDPTKKESLPWIEKYRPANLSEVISHDSKIEVLNRLIKKRDIPHLLLYGKPGTGKCLGKGTEVRMFDGKLKKVEEIKIGELLMGDDSTPRKVLSVCQGREDLYQIKQSNGIDYVVNASHILSVKKTKSNIIIWDKERQCYRLDGHDQSGNYYSERFHVKRDDIKRRGGSRKIQVIYDNPLAAFKAAHLRLNEIKSSDFINKGDTIDICLKDYLKKPKSWKRQFKGYRVGVEYLGRDISLDPYLLGIWLGDGISSKPNITTADQVIRDYLRNYAKEQNLVMRLDNKGDPNTFTITSGTKFGSRQRNPFRNSLKQYNLFKNKHIPSNYKYNSREVRLKLLAGILDSDGSKGKGENYYDLTMKSEKLIDDIVELCLSLGFKCTKSPCEKACTNSTSKHAIRKNENDKYGSVVGQYYRLYISGTYVSEIPVLLERKNTDYQNDNLDFTVSHLEVECLGEGDYYGFELDQNGRFLLKDYTVTHNTSLILALAKTMYGSNYRRYILELNASDDRGIDIVRNRIPMFAKTKSDDMRFVILDEADAMTADAQSALRRIMELYIRTCRFCLICNNINKIIPGIQSRCAPMRFGVLEKISIRGKLENIIEKEKIEIEDGAISQLLEIHQDFRQILNTLQCLKSIRFGEIIRAEDVSNYLGKADIKLTEELIEMLETQPFKKCYQRLMDLHRENRVSMIDFIKNLVDYIIDQDEMSEQRRSYLLDGLARVEYRMITGSDTEIQLASLVGIWLGNRDQ